MGLDLSDTQVLYPKPVVAPHAAYQFMQPWYEDYQRRLGASVFGAPGQYGGLIDQPQPIPIEGTAGLSPMEIMARQGAMGVGPYEPAYGTASQLMGEAAGGYRGSTGAFNPYTMISPYYDPYETDVVQDTLERMRRASAQEDIAGRAQDISSGAFGGSRGRLLAGERLAESERGILGALSGIRGQGFQRAQEAAMGDYGRRMSMLSGAAGGLGSIAGQVLGMGGQRQQELMSQLQMMNLLGGQGRDISQQGLSRLYQAALRKSQEPWERVMRGQALLAGIQPGQLVGGYETKLMQPQTWQEPTGLGDIIETGGGIAGLLKSINDIFKLWGQPKEPEEPEGKSEGGYIQKPKKYNDGGIVSGLVPIHMQEGTDIYDIDDPNYVEPGLGEGSIIGLLAEPLIEKLMQRDIDKHGEVQPGTWAIISALVGGTAIVGRGRPPKVPKIPKGKSLETQEAILNRKLRAAAAKANRRKQQRKTTTGTTPLLTGPGSAGGPRPGMPVPVGTGPGGAGVGGAGGAGAGAGAAAPSIGSKAWDLIKGLGGGIKSGYGKYKGAILPTAIVGSIGYNILTGDDEETTVTPKVKRDVAALIAKLETQKARHEKTKSKAKRDEIWEDIIKTTGRLSEMMHAPGRRQTTIGDLGRIFSEERMDIGEEDAEVRRLEALSEMMGGEFSPAQLWEAEQTGQPPAGGYDRTILIRSIMEDMFPDTGRGRTMEEQQQMIAVENELLTRSVSDLLDLINQGYGVLPAPQTSSFYSSYNTGAGGPIAQPKISITAAQGLTDEYDVEKAIRTGGAD